MNTILIARFTNRRDAASIARLSRKYRSKVKLLKEEELEDFYFGKLIEESMKEKKEVPLEKILKKLEE